MVSVFIPNQVTLEREDIVRLRQSKLISLECYIYLAIRLFTAGKVLAFDVDEFVETWQETDTAPCIVFQKSAVLKALSICEAKGLLETDLPVVTFSMPEE